MGIIMLRWDAHADRRLVFALSARILTTELVLMLSSDQGGENGKHGGYGTDSCLMWTVDPNPQVESTLLATVSDS